MKPKVFFLLLSAIVLLSGCTKTLYTTQEYVSQFRTKQEVINSFGLPTEKMEDGDYTQWLFDYGSVSTGVGIRNSRTNASVYSNYNNAYGNANTTGTTVTRFSNYNRYLKFVFDKNGRIVNSTWQGVDLSVKKKNTVGTILCVVAVIGVSLGIGVLAAGGE